MKFLGRFQTIKTIILAILITISVTPVIAQAETSPIVFMIEVGGNDHIPTAKILGAISNTRMGEPLDSRKVQMDIKSILDLGYFSDVQIATEKMLDGIKLRFIVVENPLFKGVRITGLTKIKPEELQPLFSQKPGDVFNSVIFRQDLDQVKKFCLEKKGLFIESKTTSGITLAPDGTVQLDLVELKYGKVVILGLEKTKEEVIRRELSIKEGDIIDYNELKEEYARLTRLRLFDSIGFQWEKGADPETMNLVVEVKEALTGTFEAGISYGESTGNIGGLIKFTEGNLMGLGQSVSLDISFDKDSDNISFSFYEPWLDDKHTSFGMSLWNSESTITSTITSWDPSVTEVRDMDLDQTGISISLGRQFWKDTTVRLKFNFEENQVAKIKKEDSDEEVTVNPSKHPLKFWDNSAQLELIRNKLVYNDSQFVSGGNYLYTSYTNAGDLMGGEFNYQKYVLEGKYFRTLAPNLVWGARLQEAYLTGDYPDYDALYLGGMYKLRGYDDHRFDSPETRDLIGNQTLLFNTELRYRLSSNKNFEFVVFYDAGQVNNTNTASDYGVGLRFNVPYLGMFRLDQAWGGPEKKFVFSLGEMF